MVLQKQWRQPMLKAGIGMILRATVKLPILLEDLRLNTIDHTRSLYAREKLKICGTLKFT